MTNGNIIKYEDYTREQCAEACNSDEQCKGFEYGVYHGGADYYNPKDCQLKNYANMDGCDGANANLDFCVKNRNSSSAQVHLISVRREMEFKFLFQKRRFWCKIVQFFFLNFFPGFTGPHPPPPQECDFLN